MIKLLEYSQENIEMKDFFDTSFTNGLPKFETNPVAFSNWFENNFQIISSKLQKINCKKYKQGIIEIIEEIDILNDTFIRENENNFSQIYIQQNNIILDSNYIYLYEIKTDSNYFYSSIFASTSFVYLLVDNDNVFLSDFDDYVFEIN